MGKVLFSLLLAPMVLFAQSQALNEWVYQLRNPETEPAAFRTAIENIGEYLARCALEEMATKEIDVQTLTGAIAKQRIVSEVPVLVTILRAGLPLNAGVQKVFPGAEVGFLAMSRNEETLKASVDYVALPELKDRTVLLTDTMLATGGSLLDAIRIIERREPKRIIVIAAIASQPGIERISQSCPSVKIFAAAIDPFLNDRGYIVPGLGDAGDRAYGEKRCGNKF